MQFPSIWPRRLLVLLALVAPAATALPLWELTGTPNRILVLGSIHFLRPADYPLAAPITAAFESADVILMEIDMDDLDAAASAQAIAGLARDPGGRNLQELLGPAAYSEAAAAARRLGLDLQPLLPFEPWYAAVALTQLRLGQLGFDPALGVEARLAADARRLDKEIRGLETLEEQLGALDGLSAGAQRDFLRTTLEDAAEVGDIAGTMITAWKAGDVDTLDDELLDDVRDQPEVYRALIVRRNERFAEQIRRLAGDDRDYLVILGTLHLVGPDSVLGMLDRKGIRSRQVDSPAPAED